MTHADVLRPSFIHNHGYNPMFHDHKSYVLHTLGKQSGFTGHLADPTPVVRVLSSYEHRLREPQHKSVEQNGHPAEFTLPQSQPQSFGPMSEPQGSREQNGHPSEFTLPQSKPQSFTPHLNHATSSTCGNPSVPIQFQSKPQETSANERSGHPSVFTSATHHVHSPLNDNRNGHLADVVHSHSPQR